VAHAERVVAVLADPIKWLSADFSDSSCPHSVRTATPMLAMPPPPGLLRIPAITPAQIEATQDRGAYVPWEWQAVSSCHANSILVKPQITAT